ncbi:UDP-galactose 4-epimerase [Klenkia soli]|uniref:UDP-glucose 4-epimerase n=1 Tax=Klenkia soli TaxID=1052260 RepID=A0A1H0IR08_9ACTN|nr:UDP-glucose 4-epimerase GalE [Klenkia soli]SDO33825.1 UDP-galactose 4-epimerase [Klenkia soli]
MGTRGHWVVTGGAGYVGGHVVRALHRAGLDQVVIDDLSTGVAARLPRGVPLVRGQVGDRDVLDACLPGAAGVVHLAAQTSAPGSVRDPLAHYRANVADVVTLTSAILDHGVDKLVASSSAAVYGATSGSAQLSRHTETDVLHPQSPYGKTKMIGEMVLADAVASGLSSIALRYFNVAGAATEVLADRKVGGLPSAVLQARRTGRPLPVHGLDHPTPDGTAVRDYVHAVDVASAHVAAVARLMDAALGASVYNVGTGVGSSVLDVLRVTAEITGGPVPHKIHGRRPGDPSHAVADVSAIARDLGWRARHDLGDCLQSAWETTGGHLLSRSHRTLASVS